MWARKNSGSINNLPQGYQGYVYARFNNVSIRSDTKVSNLWLKQLIDVVNQQASWKRMHLRWDEVSEKLSVYKSAAVSAESNHLPICQINAHQLDSIRRVKNRTLAEDFDILQNECKEQTGFMSSLANAFNRARYASVQGDLLMIRCNAGEVNGIFEMYIVSESIQETECWLKLLNGITGYFWTTQIKKNMLVTKSLSTSALQQPDYEETLPPAVKKSFRLTRFNTSPLTLSALGQDRPNSQFASYNFQDAARESFIDPSINRESIQVRVPSMLSASHHVVTQSFYDGDNNAKPYIPNAGGMNKLQDEAVRGEIITLIMDIQNIDSDGWISDGRLNRHLIFKIERLLALCKDLKCGTVELQSIHDAAVSQFSAEIELIQQSEKPSMELILKGINGIRAVLNYATAVIE
ncbi:hypothetical protein MIR68_001194 [Amoeboaphelidium protococcarum]|nr:hypothetical protein MIR68_001194 [Amoeboaphelidium protococcarum]